MDIVESDRRRLDYLMVVNEHTRSGAQLTLRSDVAVELRLNEDEADDLFRWHAERGNMEGANLDESLLRLLPKGVDLAEEEERKRTTVGVAQIVLSATEYRAVEAFLTQYRSAVENESVGVSGDELLEAETEAKVLALQLRSPKPKLGVVRASIDVLVDVLKGSAGSALWNAVQVLSHTFG